MMTHVWSKHVADLWTKYVIEEGGGGGEEEEEEEEEEETYSIMVYITKRNICFSFIFRYSQIFNVVFSCTEQMSHL